MRNIIVSFLGAVVVAGCATAPRPGNDGMVMESAPLSTFARPSITSAIKDTTISNNLLNDVFERNYVASRHAFIVDPRVDTRYLQDRYEFDAWLRAQISLPKHAIVISMSGGGTRAATLGQTVLNVLGQYGAAGDPKHTLADNVIAISATSGGAMTAAAFALTRALCDPHVPDVLIDCETAWRNYRQVEDNIEQAHLENFVVSHSLLPWTWSDRARPFEKFFDKLYEPLGKNLTFGMLMNAPQAPFLILDSTDINNNRTFEFTSEYFSELCSNISRLPISVAVAAAGNFPFLSTDIELQNFQSDKRCWRWRPNKGEPSGAQIAAAEDDYFLLKQMVHPSPAQPDATVNCGQDGNDSALKDLNCGLRARYRLAMQLASPSNVLPPNNGTDPARRIDWIHLYDGGLADNLALWPMMRFLENPDYLEAMANKGVQDITLIIVNARSDATPAGNVHDGSPDWFSLFFDTAYDPIDRASALTQAFALSDLESAFFHICRSSSDGIHVCIKNECESMYTEDANVKKYYHRQCGYGNDDNTGDNPYKKCIEAHEAADLCSPRNASWLMADRSEVIKRKYPKVIYPVDIDFDYLAGLDSRGELSKRLVLLREAAKNIETQDPLGGPEPAKYVAMLGKKCWSENNFLCSELDGNAGKIVKYAGEVLMARDPCFKRLRSDFDGDIISLEGSNTGWSSAQQIQLQDERSPDDWKDVACQAALLVTLPGRGLIPPN